MGKASSSKKVARAARAAGRPGAKKNYAWPAAIGAVIVLGVVLIVASFGGTSNAAPVVGDHWHAAYGIYDCGKFLPAQQDIQEDSSGIHTHGEGLMHIHPFSSKYTGGGANLFHFGQQTGFKLTDSSFKSGTVSRTTGDKCGTKKGQVELVTWKTPGDTSPKVIRKDIADYAPKDGSVWVLAFVAKGTKVPLPPAAANLADPLAAEEGRQPATGGTATTVAGDTGTTVPGTSTTVAGGTATTAPGTATTAAPGTPNTATTVPGGTGTTVKPGPATTTAPAPATTTAP
jgi:hypothetical protein